MGNACRSCVHRRSDSKSPPDGTVNTGVDWILINNVRKMFDEFQKLDVKQTEHWVHRDRSSQMTAHHFVHENTIPRTISVVEHDLPDKLQRKYFSQLTHCDGYDISNTSNSHRNGECIDSNTITHDKEIIKSSENINDVSSSTEILLGEDHTWSNLPNEMKIFKQRIVKHKESLKRPSVGLTVKRREFEQVSEQEQNRENYLTMTSLGGHSISSNVIFPPSEDDVIYV
ncbi:uncharacterized protein LOC144343806 [Saccoglossus kowalevskii]